MHCRCLAQWQASRRQEFQASSHCEVCKEAYWGLQQQGGSTSAGQQAAGGPAAGAAAAAAAVAARVVLPLQAVHLLEVMPGLVKRMVDPALDLAPACRVAWGWLR
jgi:hypothetical protein